MKTQNDGLKTKNENMSHEIAALKLQNEALSNQATQSASSHPISKSYHVWSEEEDAWLADMHTRLISSHEMTRKELSRATREIIKQFIAEFGSICSEHAIAVRISRLNR